MRSFYQKAPAQRIHIISFQQVAPTKVIKSSMNPHDLLRRHWAISRRRISWIVTKFLTFFSFTMISHHQANTSPKFYLHFAVLTVSISSTTSLFLSAAAGAASEICIKQNNPKSKHTTISILVISNSPFSMYRNQNQLMKVFTKLFFSLFTLHSWWTFQQLVELSSELQPSNDVDFYRKFFFRWMKISLSLSLVMNFFLSKSVESSFLVTQRFFFCLLHPDSFIKM